MKPTARVFSQLSRPIDAQRARTIAFIGLGQMGANMAHNLFARSFQDTNGQAQFVVCDARVEAAQKFAADFCSNFHSAKVNVVSSPAEAVFSSSTIVTMLPASPHVRQVYSDSNGIVSALHTLPAEHLESTLCIDSTTLDVQVARDTAEHVRQTGGTMVDAPVSGGVTGAKAASLSFLVGGTQDAFGRASPFLDRMGKKIIYCGPSGAGLAAKICNNLVLGVQQVVVAEAMLLGQKLGLDPATLATVINNATGACWASSTNNPVPGALPDKTPPCTNDYLGGFATHLMLKDLGLATSVGDAMKSPLPLGKTAERVYAEVIEQRPELAGKDFSSVYEHLRLGSTEQHD